MTTQEESLVLVFVPALGSLLISAEDKKGEPLSPDEVFEIRDAAACITMTTEDARKMEESRGYQDINPENCWYDWQILRRELDRKPDLDPGPRLNQIQSSDPAYQQTILDARETLDQFRTMLPSDGAALFSAMVKTTIVDGESSAAMWLNNARLSEDGFVAEFFEVPEMLKKYNVGDRLDIAVEELLDWMVNDDGVLHGGYSIRYYRSTLPEEEVAAYDAYIGVEKYD
jgi:uncharacterized protein YegJ (DUF2314 family)